MSDPEARDDKDFTILEPHSAPEGHSTSKNVKGDAENVGEATGGFLGGVTGMTLGIAGGPIGAVVGGIAGALGGWWAGKGVADAFTDKDYAAYRAHYASSPDQMADRTFDQVSPAYALGHLAGRNPDYATRTFDQLEPELQRTWRDDFVRKHGQWPAVRNYARVAFDRARSDDQR